jgi:hypothetical protein
MSEPTGARSILRLNGDLAGVFIEIDAGAKFRRGGNDSQRSCFWAG